MDPRSWVSLAVVTEVGFDPEEGIFVDVTTLPAGDKLTARYSSAYAGNGFGLYVPIKVDDEVVVGVPEGDPSHGLVVMGRLYSPSATPPSEFDGNAADGETPTEQLVLIVEQGKTLYVKVSGGGNVEIDCLDNSKVSLGGKTGSAGMEPATMGQQATDALAALKSYVVGEFANIALSFGSILPPVPVPYTPGLPPVLPDVRAAKVEVK